jgi:hypothetical protein
MTTTPPTPSDGDGHGPVDPVEGPPAGAPRPAAAAPRPPPPPPTTGPRRPRSEEQV